MPLQSSVSAIIKFASSSRLASSTASRLCRTHHIRSVRPISQVSRSLLHSSKKVARVGSIPKDKHKPASVKELALALPTRAWRRITWPGATGEKLSSRFSRVRVRVAHRDYWLADSRPEEWLLIEWPDGEKEPIKYWLSTLPEDVAFRELVDIAKLRWRIERDYQEL